MFDDPSTSLPPSAEADRLARLEERLARIERRLGLSAAPAVVEAPPALRPVVAPVAPAAAERANEEFEFEVGQRLFARVGIATLTIGGAFLLSLPLPALGRFGPSLAGVGVGGVLLGLARSWQRGYELVANHLRGAGMVLLWCAALRLFFFGPQPALVADSIAGYLLLGAVVAVNLVIGWRRKSPRLVALSLVMGYASALAIGAAWPVLVAVLVQALIAMEVDRREKWRLVVVAASVLGPLTYFLWASGNPLRGGAYHFVTAPAAAPAGLLMAMLVMALGSLGTGAAGRETVFAGVRAALNCALGYGFFLVHTAAAFPAGFVPAQVAASVLLIAVAVACWKRQQCRASTFFYAMTGYGALSLAIIRASPMPEVFVWLSLQSIVVVGTAAWFRSRFIVVANFFIYLAIVLGYVLLKERETGISVGIGIVALVSARILNWQKGQLELKTELMRNAYLVSGFIIFPYSLYFLVPGTYVGLAWTGLALVYYALNLIVRSQKYRWMGHGTLLLTTIYLVTVGTRNFEPLYRVVSFLALGTVLLVVSSVFTRLRRGRGPKTEAPSTIVG